MERCPNCRARRDGNESCRRCGMDLTTLLAVERAADHLITRGITHLAAAEAKAARDDLTRALGLHSEPFAERLLGFAQTLDALGHQRLSGAQQGLPDDDRDSPD